MATPIAAEPLDLPTPFSQMEVLEEDALAFVIIVEELGQELEVAQNEYLCNSGFAFDPTIGSCSFSIQVNPIETQVASVELDRAEEALFGPSVFSGDEARSADSGSIQSEEDKSQVISIDNIE